MKKSRYHIHTGCKYFFITFYILILHIKNPVKAENADSTKVKNNYLFSVSGQCGYIIPNNPYLEHSVNDPYKHKRFGLASFQFLKQTSGEKFWERVYDYPIYGIGINTTTFPDNKEFSHPVALFGVFKAPVFRWNSMSLNADNGLGLSFNPKIFDPSLNELGQFVNPNIAFSSHITSYITLGLNIGYDLNRHLCLRLGYDFVHYSNGRARTPNGGLNMYSPKFTLEYNANGFEKPIVKKTVPPYIKNTSVDLSAYGSFKNFVCTMPGVDTLTKYKGIYYKIFGVTAALNRQLSYKSKFGIGFTIGYDGNNNTSVTLQNGAFVVDEGPLASRINLSAFVSYELVIDRFSIVMQPGIYIINKPKDYISLITYEIRPVTYQRLGIKYHINEKLFAQISVHAYLFHHADFIEWTMGYKIGLPEKKIMSRNENHFVN